MNMSKTAIAGNYLEDPFSQYQTEIHLGRAMSMVTQKCAFDWLVSEWSWCVHYCTEGSALRNRVTGLLTAENHASTRRSGSETVASPCVKTVGGHV
mmetsp:Transcript_44383/g.117292  ORF Transcript_44383/g.117292 Transcript_44383/m.117292 type:complete len:96 (+) Transcript_44383:515-802(+)